MQMFTLQGMQTNHTQSYLTRWWSSRGPSNRQVIYRLDTSCPVVWSSFGLLVQCSFLANRSPCDFQRWDARLATVLLHIWHSPRALLPLGESAGVFWGAGVTGTGFFNIVGLFPVSSSDDDVSPPGKYSPGHANKSHSVLPNKVMI